MYVCMYVCCIVCFLPVSSNLKWGSSAKSQENTRSQFVTRTIANAEYGARFSTPRNCIESGNRGGKQTKVPSKPIRQWSGVLKRPDETLVNTRDKQTALFFRERFARPRKNSTVPIPKRLTSTTDFSKNRDFCRMHCMVGKSGERFDNCPDVPSFRKISGPSNLCCWKIISCRGSVVIERLSTAHDALCSEIVSVDSVRELWDFRWELLRRIEAESA